MQVYPSQPRNIQQPLRDYLAKGDNDGGVRLDTGQKIERLYRFESRRLVDAHAGFCRYLLDGRRGYVLAPPSRTVRLRDHCLYGKFRICEQRSQRGNGKFWRAAEDDAHCDLVGSPRRLPLSAFLELADPS